jgi:Ca-activated chloride channel family protein
MAARRMHHARHASVPDAPRAAVTFLWPHNLWLLVMVPFLAAAYAWRARAAPARIPAGRLMREALHLRGPGRHVPPALFGVALAMLLAAMALPETVLTLPTARPTVILAIDVSGSMQADDVEPTRLGAAQAAAREFARTLPADARIGIVSFTDNAGMVQPPTADRERVLAAIDTLQPQLGTAIGRGILESLKALLPEGHFDLEDASVGSSQPTPSGGSSRSALASSLGFSGAGAIVLLTDGQNTDGPSPVEAALLAAEEGVRIYTVGVGTPDGRIYRGLASSLAVGIDESALRMIASLTKGEYFYASTALDLKKVYAGLGSRLVLEQNHIEVTALFCALGALVLAAGGLLSLLWFGRLA